VTIFEPVRPLLGVRPVVSSLSVSLVTVSQSAPDLSLIFLESLEYFIEVYLVLSILSKRFRCSNESNQKLEGRNLSVWSDLQFPAT
jgi:hypothetical protein